MKVIQLADTCICCGASDLASSPAVLMPFVASRALGQEPLEISASWGMRDLKSGMAYTLCHSLQCRACGCLFLDYRFTPVQMASLYADYRGPAYTHQRDTFNQAMPPQRLGCFQPANAMSPMSRHGLHLF